MAAYWAKVQRHFPNGGRNSPQYRTLAARCGLAPTARPRSFADFGLVINQEAACAPRVDVLVGVHSAVGHSARRRVIRETWASVRFVRSRRLVVLFFLGRPADASQQAAVAEEAEQFGDIVQRDFIDSYRNMTLKHLGLFDWTMEYCPGAQWLVKVDDDVFVDVFHLEEFLRAYRPASICCRQLTGAPNRSPDMKWYVTQQEFGGKRFPKYCEGFAYIVRPPVAQLLYWCSVFTKHLWIDDVYILGILVGKLGIKVQEPLSGHMWQDLLPSHTGARIADNIFLVGRRNSLLPQTWRRLQRAAILHSY